MNVFELSASLGLDTSKFSEGLSGAGSALSGVGSAITTTINVVKTLDSALTTVSDTVAKGTIAVVTSTAGIAKAIDSNVMGAVDQALGVVVDGFEQMAQAGFSFFESVVQEGMSFDAAMGQVSATLLKTRDDFDENMVKVEGYQGNLRDYAKRLGATTKFTATQAGEALNYMALAGYNAQKSAEMLPGVLNLAAAGAMDLGTASDVVTDAITALGIEEQDVTKFIDQMAKTASSSNTSVSQLGDALLSIGATGRMVTGGFTELNLVLGVLANNGIKASEGGNMLRRLITRLVSPTKEAQGWLDKLGVSVYDASGQMKALPELFQELGGALSGLSEAERNVAVSDLFGQYALAGANALLGTTADSWNGLAAAIDDAAGSAEEMAKIQRETLPGALTILQSAISGVKIELFDLISPTAKEFVETLSNGLSEVAEEVSNGNFEAAFNRLGNTAADLITQGITLVLENEKTINEFIVGIVDFIERVGSAVFTGGSEVLPQLLGHILYFSSLLISSFAEFLSNPENVATIEDTISHLIKQVSTFLDQNQDELYTIFSTLFDIGIKFIGDLFVLKRETIYSILYQKFTDILDDLTENISTYLDGEKVGEMAQKIVDFISAIAGQLVTLTAEVVPVLLPILVDIGDKLIAALVEFLSDDKNTKKISQTMADILNSLSDFLDKHQEDFNFIVDQLWDIAGRQLFKIFVLRRKAAAKTLSHLIYRILKDAIDGTIGEFFDVETDENKPGYTIGTNIIMGIVKGMAAGMNMLPVTIADTVKNVIGWFSEDLDIHSPSRVMRDKIGKNIALGIGVGFTETMDTVAKDMADAIPQDYDISPTVTSTYGSTQGKVLNVDIHIGTVNGASAADAQNLGNTISEMIYNKIYRETVAVV